MNDKLEYLIKYSVGSPPSRDYYSLKVLQDEVILHLWRISHGPHKAPIIHSVKFAEFDQEKSLQDKIRHGFGEHLLKYVKNITEGNLNSLLTLPKSLIEKITRYLKFTDIVKLSSLSHVAYEIFNADSVWQILYERDKETRVSLEEKQKAKVYGWKRLYKDRQIQMSLKNKKDLRIQSSTKFANDLKINKSLSRLTSGALKDVSKTASTSNVTAKKHTESSSTDLVTIPLSKTTSDTRFWANTKNEKLLPKRRNVKNAVPEFNINERNVQKEDIIASRMRAKPEAKSISNNKRDESIDKQHEKLEKHKTNNINAKLQKSKSKPVAPKTHSLSKNTIKNTKSSSSLAQNSHSKTRSKTKTKPEKAATKYEIFNTAEELANKPFIVGDGNFDLADLIEASLKNIRSPRSIFNYDFNYTQQSDATKDASRISNKIINVDKLQLKPSRSDFITNDFSNRMTRGGTLEKLSEKSESFSGSESSESLMHNEKLLPGKDNKTLSLSEKYMKAREELRKSLN